ncbi:chromatin assembly factor 1 subunit A-like [Daphnia pulex]|uniref:chromatin assembly factor 1 subunit A-like n=1 Tax=Daphnia pulex TaxID=6669 RepID=UPI001EDF138F|nr:chromatin assembly factor 1 subunit A-like [Daphnia pulex]
MRGKRNLDNGPGPIPQRWLHCPRKAKSAVGGKFLAFQTPLDARDDSQVDDEYNVHPEMVFSSAKNLLKLKIGLWIDLTNTSRYYDKNVVEENACKYVKLECKGHSETPNPETVDLFIKICTEFISQNPSQIIGVHCTHGFNRTGFLIVSYLVQALDWSVGAAVKEFSKARPPGILKQEYIRELFTLYGDMDEAAPAPAFPMWHCKADDDTLIKEKTEAVDGVTIAKTSTFNLLVDYPSSDESDASMDDSGKTRPDETSTPRKGVKGKKKPALSQEERLSQVFTNFFTQKKTTPAKSDDQPSCHNSLTCILAFPPFQIKENMKLAPTVRTEFDTLRKENFEQILQKSKPTTELNPRQYIENRGRSCGATWPLDKDNENNDVEVIGEDEAEAPTIVHAVSRRMRPKLLKFYENRRPAYWGTWRKSSNTVGPRRPFGKEVIFDYDVDSDDEWESVEPGESLTDSEGEGEEKEPADEYEVNEFLVPHGYLSDEEGEKDEDERALSPSAAKIKLKLKEEQFEREMKKETFDIKPSLIGCCWSDDLNPNPQHLKVLERNAAVVLSSTLPIELKSEYGEPDENINKKTTKRFVNEKDIPDLIRVLHGSLFGKSTIVQEFQLHLERNRDGENQKGPSKAQILAKIAQIASYSRCTEAGAMNGRKCWLVQPNFLEHYNLAELSVINAWEFATETKKRGSKADESKDPARVAH